jgi:hypothetical protein
VPVIECGCLKFESAAAMSERESRAERFQTSLFREACETREIWPLPAPAVDLLIWTWRWPSKFFALYHIGRPSFAKASEGILLRDQAGFNPAKGVA